MQKYYFIANFDISQMFSVTCRKLKFIMIDYWIIIIIVASERQQVQGQFVCKL